MRRLGVYSVVLCLLLLALPVATQEEEGNIVQVIDQSVKPGMEAQYEEGRKAHMAWHKAQNDPWGWLVWQVISGEGSGQYVVGTFGHKWSDFDTPSVSEEGDSADFEKNIAPYVNAPQTRYYAFLPKVSRPWEGTPKMNEVIFFHVEYGEGQTFNYLIKKFHDGIGKTNWPVHYSWYVLVNGGASGTYVLVLPRESWAAFKGPDKPFDAMLEEAYGRQEAEALIHKLGKVVKYTENSIIQNRPDLSYIPEKGGM